MKRVGWRSGRRQTEWKRCAVKGVCGVRHWWAQKLRRRNERREWQETYDLMCIEALNVDLRIAKAVRYGARLEAKSVGSRVGATEEDRYCTVERSMELDGESGGSRKQKRTRCDQRENGQGGAEAEDKGAFAYRENLGRYRRGANRVWRAARWKRAVLARKVVWLWKQGRARDTKWKGICRRKKSVCPMRVFGRVEYRCEALEALEEVLLTEMCHLANGRRQLKLDRTAERGARRCAEGWMMRWSRVRTICLGMRWKWMIAMPRREMGV